MSEINVFISSPNEINKVSKKQLSNLFLKKTDKLNGKRVITIDTKEDKEEFYQKVLNKTPSQIHAYWMKQIFSGKKVPPKIYTRKKVIQILKNSKNTIGYSSEPMESKSIYATY